LLVANACHHAKKHRVARPRQPEAVKRGGEILRRAWQGAALERLFHAGDNGADIAQTVLDHEDLSTSRVRVHGPLGHEATGQPFQNKLVEDRTSRARISDKIAYFTIVVLCFAFDGPPKQQWNMGIVQVLLAR